MSGEALVQVVFDLDVVDGWPPVGTECLWARDLGDGRYRLENTPWFVDGIANGDVVLATEDADGILRAGERVEWSGWGTVRVIPRRDGRLFGSLQAVLDTFAPFDVTGEGIEEYRMVALEIPPSADLVTLQRTLAEGEADGTWFYDEGCVAEDWPGA